MRLSEIVTGQIFYEESSGSSVRMIALGDAFQTTTLDGDPAWAVDAMNTDTEIPIRLSVHAAYPQYLKLRPEIYFKQSTMVFDWQETK